MSIRDSSKLRHVLGAVLLVGSFYVVLDLPLRELANWAERNADSYPWADEDYLRYLLPSLFDNRSERLLIVGPSEAREDWLYERFEQAFPGLDAFQASISSAGFRDLQAGLEYLRLAYGEDALPAVLVLGMTPRFLANIPREPGPVVSSITRYSPGYSLSFDETGPHFVRKRLPESLLARVRFQFKQPGRYQSALCAAALHLLGGVRNPPRPEELLDSERDRLDRAAVVAEARRDLYFCRSPARYHHLGRESTMESARSWLRRPGSMWQAVHAWNPAEEREQVLSELKRLRDFTNRYGIELYVVNLPEHPANRAEYRPEYYEEYRRLLRVGFAGVPCLDLHQFLRAEDFTDHAHADLDAAWRVTDRTIAFIRDARIVRNQQASAASLSRPASSGQRQTLRPVLDPAPATARGGGRASYE